MKTQLHPFPVTAATKSRLQDFNFDKFTFGATPTDHMFVAEYEQGVWKDPRIEPFHDLSLSPITLALHYGQTVFEGMKAFRMRDGRINIFRPDQHAHRFNRSLERLCMPAVPEEMFLQALTELVKLESNWIPGNPDIALYIRPFVIATEPRLGVKVSDEYLFSIVCTPIGKYYANPVRVKIETEYVRAAEGGTGYAKCGGNYGASFYPAQKAKEQGFDQVLWTDGKHNEFIEESGTMNIMFLIGDTLVTPALNGAILDGITRKSALVLAKDMGVKVEERRISYKELLEVFEAGTYIEAFGIGTAAVISPISCINIAGTDYFPSTGENAFMFRLQKELAAIRLGDAPDKYGWNYIVE